jgi:hypothetical protein
VFYGAAEFSRDCDIALLCDDQNIERLRGALADLEAEPIAVPHFRMEYLERGHAIHFRCHAECANGMRLDVMSRMRGVAPFNELWPRRMTLEYDRATRIEIMGLADLVTAKMTQRDKDWPMIRRLVEANFAQSREQPTDDHIKFWLRHARTPHIIKQASGANPALTQDVERERPLLRGVLGKSDEEIDEALEQEEKHEREADRRYWQPLKAELEIMRRERPRP